MFFKKELTQKKKAALAMCRAAMRTIHLVLNELAQIKLVR
jgi:hypothetical protein